MREFDPIWDGAQGPIFRFSVRDVAGVRDMATAAVELYVEDDDGNPLGMRPGVVISPKVNGEVNVMLKGSETDFAGLGDRLVLVPKFYYATSLAGLPATNLLANPSFDAATGTPPARLPDGWTLVGARTATWDNYANDPAPPAIFGTFQLVKHATVSEPDYIQQVLSLSAAAGDVLSVGCWHRCHSGAGEAANDDHALKFHLGLNADTIQRLRVGSNDWYFTVGSVVADTTFSAATVAIDLRGTTMSNRLDEAFAFLGTWRTFFGERKRIQVKPRSRPVKSTNQIAKVGGFEKDSNADGFPDTWSNQAAGVTFSMEKIPANVAEGSSSLKAVLTDETNNLIRLVWRDKYLAGETWRARVKVKTSGALSGGSGTGGYSIALQTAPFDGVDQLASTTLGTSLGSFTDHEVTLALTADRSELWITINLNGQTGTLWLDDVRLDRTATP